jgi:CO/xanthine dehydrogenase Mo-binding subunit
MEPRGAVGVYLPAEDRYIIHTPVQRAHPYRSEIARQVLKIAESKVRVICIDVGGSFGMKTPVFNEAPLVMFASKVTGRPLKWMSTRTEAFLSDAQARDNVTEAELALDKDGTFLAMRVKTIAAIGAYLQRFSSTPERWPVPIARRRCSPTSPAFSPTPIRCALTAATAGRKPPMSSNASSTSPPMNSASIRPSCAGVITSRPARCRSRPG